MEVFRVLRRGNRSESRITTLDFGKADFFLFRDFLGRVPWDKRTPWREKGPLIFTDHLLQVQEWSIPMSRKSGKNIGKPAWVNKELTKLKLKRDQKTSRVPAYLNSSVML